MCHFLLVVVVVNCGFCLPPLQDFDFQCQEDSCRWWRECTQASQENQRQQCQWGSYWRGSSCPCGWAPGCWPGWTRCPPCTPALPTNRGLGGRTPEESLYSARFWMFPIHSETYFSPSWKTCWCWWIKGAPYSRTNFFALFIGFLSPSKEPLFVWLMFSDGLATCCPVGKYLHQCASFGLPSLASLLYFILSSYSCFEWMHLWHHSLESNLKHAVTFSMNQYNMYPICFAKCQYSYSIFSAKHFSDIRKDISKCTNVDIFILKCFRKLVGRLIEKSLEIS